MPSFQIVLSVTTSLGHQRQIYKSNNVLLLYVLKAYWIDASDGYPVSTCNYPVRNVCMCVCAFALAGVRQDFGRSKEIK